MDSTILFADIRSFTAFSENTLPYDIVHILNRYFDAICAAIDRNGGYIDKYMGDGIMAVFGLDPELAEPHPVLAMQAAKEMLEALVRFNGFLKARYHHEFRIGIGLHSGPVIVGELGFPKKREYTAIGDTVNTASRIEALNKIYPMHPVLISDQTYDALGSRRSEFALIDLGEIEIRGKAEPVRVWAVAGRDA